MEQPQPGHRFGSLEALPATLPPPTRKKQRGFAFKRVTAWYLLHSPAYAEIVEHVWLWDD